MSHLLIVPVMLPLLMAGVLLGAHRLPMVWQRAIGLLASIGFLAASMALLWGAADGATQIYRLGGWAPPFGIILVLDRLSALMLCATAVLAVPAALYATRGADEAAVHFHALFQFQLFGLAMAFLTGDLFNLFVAFEILLIASYSLLMHGGGARRSRAGLHYVVLNLVGSAFFIVGVGLLYGVTGTLNMADLARAIAEASPENHGLLRAAAWLLLMVFGLKAALLPLLFWLPRAYTAASAPVAALFAILTKVGVYAILRVHGTLFGAEAGELAGVALPILWPLALATLIFGALGMLGTRSFGGIVAYLVIMSSGTLLAAVALGTPAAVAAALYYLLHSTWVAAALFLLTDLLANTRGDARFDGAPQAPPPPWLAAMFILLAIAAVGLPPLSGFIGKLLLLMAAQDAGGLLLWPVLLGAAVAALLALSRAGSAMFWRCDTTQTALPADRIAVTATLLLALAPVILAVFAAPTLEYLTATAYQWQDVSGYIDSVLGDPHAGGGP